MVYIGAVKQLFTFPFFDAQANYLAKVLGKSIEVPDSEEMKAEFQASSEALKKLPTVVETIKYQSDYIGGLNKESGFAPEMDSDLLNKNFVDFVANKIEDIRTFRDKTHVSILNGEKSPFLKSEPWATRMDSSKQAYLDGLEC